MTFDPFFVGLHGESQDRGSKSQDTLLESQNRSWKSQDTLLESQDPSTFFANHKIETPNHKIH